MKEEIAKLEIIGIKKDGSRVNVIAKVGKPYRVEGNEELDEWACPVSLEPLFSSLHDAHGGGSFQSLCMATNLIIDLLRGFEEQGGRLIHDDGTDFPIHAYWFGARDST